jgi:hypothetical protein
MTDRSKDIRSEFLIVGEGAGDAALIRYLASDRDIESFQVEDAGGSSKFQAFITGLAARAGFDKLRGLVVVADADSGADESFKNIRTQMKAAKIPCPHAPYIVAGLPNIAYTTYVLMIPFSVSSGTITSNTGALETILLPSAEEHLSKYSRCLDSWCDCVKMSDWSKVHRDKARLRSLIAAAHPDDPNIGLQYALSPNKNLIPLSHSSFDELGELLRSLPQQLRR